MSGKRARYLAEHGMTRENHTKAQLTLRDQVKHPVLLPHSAQKKISDVNYEVFPTPCAQDYKHRGPSSRQQGLSDVVRLRPVPKNNIDLTQGTFGLINDSADGKGTKEFFLTPRATDTGKGEKQKTFLKRMGDRTDACFQSLPAQIGGQLNADWVEALMGYPLYWTDVEKDCPFENRYPQAWLDGAWEDGVPRVITGQKNRPHRIKALGNSIVPQIPCLLFRSSEFDRWR